MRPAFDWVHYEAYRRLPDVARQFTAPSSAVFRLMCVFQHSVTQHNATQVFTQQKCVAYFLRHATADAAAVLAASSGASQANRNDFYFSATPEANSTYQSCVCVQPIAAERRRSLR